MPLGIDDLCPNLSSVGGEQKVTSVPHLQLHVWFYYYVGDALTCHIQFRFQQRWILLST
jgi:hypothetical protein